MNICIKEIVYEILDNDEKARENDNYLIYKVLEKALGISNITPFYSTIALMKDYGISFESITRRRRKWLEENPTIKASLKVTKMRKEEERRYIIENMHHIPRID